ncbi:MAG TPA: citrate/2-methylcitrate synthase [Streptosporangiaceae bacterium]|nr:citrate/2-methylcitrate synthase [Streptosporangiaceae bacterium]
MTEWIDAATAARRLGVKTATLYSYVSRGVLNRRRAADGRGSRFAAEEVEALARRGRPRRRRLPGDLAIESAITEISGSRLEFRGRDAVALAAAGHPFEDVAVLLWTGTLPPAAVPGQAAGWQAPAAALAAGRAAQAGLPAGTLPLERLQVIVPALAAADPFRLQLDPPAVMTAARGIIAGMVDCLPPAAAGEGTGEAPNEAPGGDPVAGGDAAIAAALAGHGPIADGTGIAGRLWPKLCPWPAEPGLLTCLRSALVMLADHELAASTFAARVAASVRADPYAVVATGLGALGGALHGGASLGAETMLAGAAGPADAPRVVGDLLRRGERIPGFGHMVYPERDPRAEFLLDAVRAAAPGSARLAVAEAVLAEVPRRGLPRANIDFALAVLAGVAGMTRGAGEAIFAVARTAGWVAHALEEYQRRAPLRPRAIRPGESPGTRHN